MTYQLDSLDLARLSTRKTAKWQNHPAEVLPAFVAEMDFPLADPIRRVLHEAIDEGALGYPPPPAAIGLREAWRDFLGERFGWRPDPELMIELPDVVKGIDFGICAFTRPGEPVVVTTPVYHPFLFTVEGAGRVLADCPMVESAAGYDFDFDAIDRALAAGARTILLCHPHNPIGKVLSRPELEQIAELALRHGARIISDEIHAPMTYPGFGHIPIASLGPEVAAITLTLTSASKTFNMPGLKAAAAIAGSREMADRLNAMPYRSRSGTGTLGMVATVAALREGGPWLDEVMDYLDGNRAHLASELRRRIPEICYRPPDATYLGWLDCRALQLAPSPQRWFLENARVAFNAGEMFGPGGQGFVRFNFGTSREVITQIVERMAGALQARR